MVPHLITALTGPINELEARILESMPAIERWFRLEWMEHTPPFYSAVDLRNGGFKLAPVATGLYPDGFGHLTPEMLPLAVQAAMAAIEKICPEAKNLLLLPDVPADSARAEAYLGHLKRLVQIFTQAGLNVRLGSLDARLTAPTALALPASAGGGQLTIEPLKRSQRRLGLKDFDPCTILVNADLAGGTPKVLENLHEQYLLPPLHAGWGVRRKSKHFGSYEEVAKKFAKLLGMDPWLIVPMTATTGALDVATAAGLEALQTHTEAMLTKVRRKYKEYGITEKPFVVVKADMGGRGLGVWTLRDARELPELQQRFAGRLASLGEDEPLELIVQEGVPTHERLAAPRPTGGRLPAAGVKELGSGPSFLENDAAAEPVVVMIDRYVVGGYYRVQAGRAADESLELPGASHVQLAFAESHHLPRPGEKPGASAPNRFYMYGVIGRLAMLAASYELEATDPDAEVYD